MMALRASVQPVIEAADQLELNARRVTRAEERQSDEAVKRIMRVEVTANRSAIERAAMLAVAQARATALRDARSVWPKNALTRGYPPPRVAQEIIDKLTAAEALVARLEAGA